MVQVAVARDLTEAEEIQTILRSAGIPSELEVAVEQHPHGAAGSRAELRALVVVGQDVGVLRALEGEAVRPVLAHPDAVPEAGAADHVAYLGVGGRHGRGHADEGGCQ